MNNKTLNIVVLSVVAVAVVAILALKLTQPKIEFPTPQKDEVTVVQLGSDLCIPCQKLSPVILELKEQMKGKMAVHKILLDREGVIKDFYKVTVIPVIIIFDQNGDEVAREIFSEETVPIAVDWIRTQTESLGVEW